MSGIGLVLNIAKDALLTQQYAMDIVSHNIANVSTEGYSKQVPTLQASESAPYAGLTFGRGVKLSDITSVTNEFIEKRLQSSTSDLSMMTEKETYMNILETIFTESSNTSISSQFSEFWNALNDLNNNPSGVPERSILIEYGSILSQSFQDTSDDLLKLGIEINNSIDTGVENVNQILDQIADTNRQILLVKTTGTPNDLIDKRTILVKKLADFIDINSYEYDDGSLTVTTSKGFVLVNRQDSYQLDFNGTDIIWESNSTSITEDIKGGKLGGWLDIRDEIIPKYQSDLDELARSTMFEINSLHSQGVGLTGFTSLTGSYQGTDRTQAMGTEDSGLDFYDRINDGSFKIWLYDSTGAVVGEETIAIDADFTTMESLSSDISTLNINGEIALNASIQGEALSLEIDQSTHPGYTFAFSDDSSNILAALGLNTFFKGSNARNMGINDNILADKNYIAAGKISSNIGHAIASVSNDPSTTGFVTTSGNPNGYTGTDDGTFNIRITNGGTTFRWSRDAGPESGDIAIGSNILLEDGVLVSFTGAAADFNDNDTFTIGVTATSDTYGVFFPGDNTNSLEMANLQYQNVTVKQWTYTRENGGSSRDVTNITLDEYFHQMVGSIGIDSQSIQREKSYTQTIQEQMSVTRDNISGVSLDEEMANLIKFQHAYMAAAKLITTAEEMLDSILQTV
jgi:flagellar hook-associated protein 1 FlgK